MRRFPAPSTTHFVAALAVTAAALAAAFALPLPAQALTIVIGGDSADLVAGSGKEVALPRAVGSFTALRVDSSVDVVAHQASAPAVTVRADDNLQPLVETVVEGGTLVVRLRQGKGFRSHHKVVVDVAFTTLTATQQHGSGDLRIASVSGPRLDATISGSGDLQIDDAKLGSFSVSVAGSGDVTISGSADEARFAVAGSGDIDATHFTVRRVTAAISGSGDARLNASESLDARVSGSGDVSYSGHPREVSRKVSGSGSIEPVN